MSLQTALTTLYNKKATMESLTKARVELEGIKQEFAAKHGQAYQACVDLKQLLMAGEASHQDYNKARAELDDATIELDAIDGAMNAIEEKMIKRLPADTERKIVDIRAELKSLNEQKESIQREFLTLVAGAAAFREYLSGGQKDMLKLPDGPDGVDDFTILGVLPSAQRDALEQVGLGEHFVFLHGDLETFYTEAVKSARVKLSVVKGPTPRLDEQIDALSNEIHSLEQLIAFDRKVAVVKLLNQERRNRGQLEDIPG